MRLRFTRLSEAAVAPVRAHGDDAGLDLHAAESASLRPGGAPASARSGGGDPRRVRRARAAALGAGRTPGIALVNSPGLIDAGYRGEVRVLLLNTDRDETFEVSPGDRIAQLVLVRHKTVEPDEVPSSRKLRVEPAASARLALGTSSRRATLRSWRAAGEPASGPSRRRGHSNLDKGDASR